VSWADGADVTAVIIKTMRADNPRIERRGYVLPAAGATAGLQWDAWCGRPQSQPPPHRLPRRPTAGWMKN